MGSLRFGFAKIKITPPMGVALAGYGLRPHRKAASVLDDLYVRAQVFSDGEHCAAMVSLDLISMAPDFAKTVRTGITKQIGIPPEFVMLSAIHSHSTPTAKFHRHWGKMDPEYIREASRKTIQAVKKAHAALEPAEIGTGQLTVDKVGYNRVRKDGPIDQTLRVVSIRRPDSKTPLALMTHYACHPVCALGDSTYVSADFPGRLNRALKESIKDVEPVFFQGALGDINPIGVHQGEDAAQQIGIRLADGTKQILESLSYSSEVEIAAAQVDCALPLDLEDARKEATAYLFEGKIRKDHDWIAEGGLMREWAMETLGLLASNPPDKLQIKIQALRIGPLVAVGIPGEAYTLIAQALREESQRPDLWVVGFANGAYGYFAAPEDYETETYAAAMTPKIYGYLPFKPETWRVITDAGREAIKLVTGEKL